MKFSSVKTKLIVLLVAIIIISNGISIAIAIKRSSSALKNAVNGTLLGIADNVRQQIYDTNEKQFAILEGLAAMPYTKDLTIPLEEKVKAISQVSKINSTYENIGYYDINGNSYTIFGKPVCIPDRVYLQAAYSGKRYVTSPSVSSVNNTLMMIYCVPVFGDNGKVIGAIAANVMGDYLSNLCQSIDIGKGEHPKILDNSDGRIIGSPDIEEVNMGKKMEDSESSDLEKILVGVTSGTRSTASFMEPQKKKLYIASYGPVGGECNWSVFCAAPYTDFFWEIAVMSRGLIISVVVAIIVSIILCFFAINVIIKPLIGVKNSISEIATGNADLTKRIVQSSSDEIGEVVNGFNTFTEKLQTIVSSLKNSKQKLKIAGEDLIASTQDTTTSITQILANIDSVHRQIDNQSGSVDQTAGAVNEIAGNISSLERMIEMQSSGVTQASAAVEQMIGNIASVNHSIEKMTQSFDELSSQTVKGAQKQAEVNSRIEKIEEQSEMLLAANRAISSIASQTNLLAMNASIEAAHAGDAGRGFSVVADEIRKLSETSSQQSKTIREQLGLIKDSINAVVGVSKESSEAFKMLSAKLQDTDQLVHQITAAMEEQNEGSKQITQALHNMNDSTSEVRLSGHEMQEGNQLILNEVKNLQDATMIIKQSMEEMSTGARKINETGSALADISEKMSESITKIGDEIDLFKV